MIGELAKSRPIKPGHTAQRSKMTNDYLRGRVSARGLIGEGDGRGAWARRFKDIVAIVIDDCGGFDDMAETKLGLIRRYAAIAVECERQESAMARGEPVDMKAYALLSDTSSRIATKLGLKRTARPGEKIANLAERIRRSTTATRP
jgi:hypothetical protein